MKKNFSLFIIAAFSLIYFQSASFAQEVVSESEIELTNHPSDKVSVDKINLNANGTVSVFTFNQVLENSTASGLRPVLKVYELSESLKLQKKMEETVLPWPAKEGKRKNRAGTSLSSSKGANEPKSSFPDFFNPIRKSEENVSVTDNPLGGPLVSNTRIQYEYNWLSNSFSIATKEKSILDIEYPSYETGGLFIHDKVLADKDSRILSLVVGNKLEGDSNQYAHYLHQDLQLLNFEGKLLKSHRLSFEYPSELRLHQFVRDEKGQVQGIIYLYGTARRYGHKVNDPDPTNYKVFFFTDGGEILFQHSFKYASKGSSSEPFYAAAANGKVYVLGKGVGKEQDYHLMVFTEKGLEVLNRVEPDLFYENTRGDYKIGIRNEYNSHFEPQGFKILQNEQVVFFGEHRYTTKNAAFDTGTNTRHPPEYHYKSYVFLLFDKEGNFLRNYVQPKGSSANKSRSAEITFLTEKNGRLQFFISEPQEGAPLVADYQLFTTGENAPSICKQCESDEKVSSLYSIDTKTDEIKVVGFAENIYSLHGLKPFMLDAKKNELLMVGRSQSMHPPIKLFFKRIRL